MTRRLARGGDDARLDGEADDGSWTTDGGDAGEQMEGGAARTGKGGGAGRLRRRRRRWRRPTSGASTRESEVAAPLIASGRGIARGCRVRTREVGSAGPRENGGVGSGSPLRVGF